MAGRDMLGPYVDAGRRNEGQVPRPYSHDAVEGNGPAKTEGLVHATASSIAHLVEGLDKLTAELAGALDRVFGPQPENASSAPERQGSAECGAHRAGHELERFERALGRLEGQVRRAEQL